MKIRKDSHKFIKNPPLARPRLQPLEPAPPQLHQQEQWQPPPPGGPRIEPPKIIHTHPNNFKSLVQRLTGKTSTSITSSSSPQSISAPNDTSATFDASRGSISPAARYAAIEKAIASNEVGFVAGVETMDQYYQHRHHQNRAMERPNFHPAGIFYPGPTSLPSRSPELFSTQTSSMPSEEVGWFNGVDMGRRGGDRVMLSPSMGELLTGRGGVLPSDFGPNGRVLGFGQQDLVGRPSRELLRLPPDASNTLYVEGLPSNCSRREVAHFGLFGDIKK